MILINKFGYENLYEQSTLLDRNNFMSNPLYPCSLKLSQTSSMLHLYSQPEIQLLEASAEKGFTGMSSNKILEKIEEYKTLIWWKSSEMLILSTMRITVCESYEWYPTKSLFFAINLKHPHILSIHIVHTVLFTIFMVLKRRICLTIKSVIFI